MYFGFKQNNVELYARMAGENYCVFSIIILFSEGKHNFIKNIRAEGEQPGEEKNVRASLRHTFPLGVIIFSFFFHSNLSFYAKSYRDHVIVLFSTSAPYVFSIENFSLPPLQPPLNPRSIPPLFNIW